MIMLTKSNLPHACVDDLTVGGFHDILRKDHIGCTGGGVAMYVADHIGAVRVQELAILDLELMWVKIKAGHDIIHMCVLLSTSKY